MQGSTSMSDDGVYEHDFGIPLQPEAGPSSGKQQTKNGKVKYTRKRTGKWFGPAIGCVHEADSPRQAA